MLYSSSHLFPELPVETPACAMSHVPHPMRTSPAQRIACIDILAFGVQYCVRTENSESEAPHVLIETRTHARRVLELNAAAQRAGLRQGMRLQEAQSVCPQVNASAEDPHAIEAARQELCAQLRTFSPWIERHPDWPDSFWVRGDGLSSLWSSATEWARAMHTHLALQGWKASVVVGYSRFFSLAIARQRPGVLKVFRTAEQEREHALNTPLHLLVSDAKLHKEFEMLGVQSLKDLQEIPTGAIQRRYGKDAARWVQWVRQEHGLQSQATTAPPSYETTVEWDQPVSQHTTLLFLLQKPLDQLLSKIQRVGHSCEALTIRCHFDWGKYIDERLEKRTRNAGIEPHGHLEFTLRAAFAHLDSIRWTELLRLRLARIVFPLGVISVKLHAHTARETVRQETWQGVERARVPDALHEALAQLRAELGDAAVSTLSIQDAHLPEARNLRQPLQRLAVAAPHPLWTPVSVRRMHARPHLLLPQSNERALVPWLQAQRHTVIDVRGPYSISGAWWEKPVERAYYYVLLDEGEVLWVYYDRVRQQWMWQGNIF